MKFTEHYIKKLKTDIDNLEIELEYHHNSDTISIGAKVKKIDKILRKISKKKNILELYITYIATQNQE